jgi:EAL and modified HD-GYP domain-containing signal transduction protein
MQQDIFIARQPVLDLDRNTFGYELLYRSGPDADTVIEDSDASTRAVIERAYLDWGMERLIGQRFGLINASSSLIERGLHRALPPEGIIFELREETPFGPEAVDAVQRARREGYHFALDNVCSVEQLEWSRLYPICSLLKIDFLRAAPEVVTAIAAQSKATRPEVLLVAEKVETAEQHELAVAAGIELFQGYYFARPNLLRKAARPANALAVVALIAETQRDDISIDRLEQVVGGDPTLAFRVLRVVNSSAFGLDRRVDSLRHAIVLLGINQVRHLAVLLAMSTTKQASEELIRLGATRARFLSRIAGRADANAAFTIGLLSVTDALYHAPIETLVAELPVSDQIATALVERAGPLGRLLDAVTACEQADTERVNFLMPGEEQRVLEHFREAVEWSDAICSAVDARTSVPGVRLREMVPG